MKPIFQTKRLICLVEEVFFTQNLLELNFVISEKEHFETTLRSSLKRKRLR
jgi:hypothetical protein